MHKTIACGLLVLVIGVSCRSASEPSPAPDAAFRDIDRFVTAVVNTVPEVPSIGLAVVRGDVTYARGYGFADVQRRAPADARTVFYIGSTTKAYTALAASILANRGLIDLDAPITRYLPEIQFAPPIDADKITIRRLLSHSAPVQNKAVVFRTAYTGEHTPAELVRLMNFSSPRPEGFRYDNLGYVVTALALERVTGRPWQQLLANSVFVPLGMNRTSASMSAARAWPLASPYELSRKGEMERLTFVKTDQTMHAAGGIVTTAEDLARWLSANVHRGHAGSRQLLPAAVFDPVLSKEADTKRTTGPFQAHGYGFGWYQAQFDGETALFHGGGYEGWRSLYSLLPEKKLAVGVMANSGVSNPVLQLITSYVYDRLRDKTGIEATYAERLDKVRKEYQAARARHIADAEARAKRPATLLHPPAAYVGRYEHRAYGTITVAQRGNDLYATIGGLGSVLEPYTEPETARVEMTPGTGEVLRFAFADDGTVKELRWNDESFVRAK